MNNKKILLVAFFMFIVSFCYAENELMDRAVKSFLHGDYRGAMQDFERLLELEQNEKAEKLLYKSIVAEAKRNLEKDDHKTAISYLERAQIINPTDMEVASLILEVKNKTKEVESNVIQPDPNLQILRKEISSARSERNTYKNRLNNLSAERTKLRKQLEKNKEELLEYKSRTETLANQNKKTTKFYLVIIAIGAVIVITLGFFIIMSILNFNRNIVDNQLQLEELEGKFTKRMEQTNEDGQALEERVARSINKMVDGQKNIVKQLTMSAAGKTQVDIEDIKDRMALHFDMQQEKLLELLNQQARAIASEKTEIIELDDRVITGVNPHVRARADSVELIPKTITDPNVAEKILKPYLEDPNNRVRANASVAIYQYNPELALKTLDKMTQSPDKWMRLSAAWALGTISSPESPALLRRLLDDIDERVKNRALKAFENMSAPQGEVSDEIRKMIERSRKNEDI